MLSFMKTSFFTRGVRTFSARYSLTFDTKVTGKYNKGKRTPNYGLINLNQYKITSLLD